MEKKFKNIETLISDLMTSKWIKSLFNISNVNVFLVGGIVRDEFLDKESKDIDIVVEGLDINSIKSILLEFGSATIEGTSFPVIKFKPKGHKGEAIDIAIPRKDIKIGKGHKGFKTIAVKTIHEDLQRRDFTINSICINLKTKEILDPFNGLTDIENKTLKATDSTAFIEDPLRILRGIQFACRFNFNIEKNTLKLMKENSHLIKEISGERIHEELRKITNKKGNTSLAFELIKETEVDLALFDNKLEFIVESSNLDFLSFIWLLSVSGGNKNPGNFLFKRLKGKSNEKEALNTIDKLLKGLSFDISENTFLVFKSFEKSPLIKNMQILPKFANIVLDKMNKGLIPSKQQDIKVDGNDIEKLNVKGKEIGILKSKIQKCALMNIFDWKNREKSLEFLKELHEKNQFN